MGTLLYGAQAREIEIDDLLLAHLEVAMLSKMRRREPFALTWREPLDDEQGVRRTVWVSDATELVFLYTTARSPELNRAWIEALAVGAERGNIHLRPEPPGERVPHEDDLVSAS
ncbi:DUF7882 family protein [Leifsonia sp. AG29]|uniref:DUF7882 family protein n=1 Tax=Leifsonia sp. AG29 TaxID=2598860 RepID=UPI00131D97FA|nr:ATP-dependent DNA ligase [Leifsonia sp. AG29]